MKVVPGVKKRVHLLSTFPVNNPLNKMYVQAGPINLLPFYHMTHNGCR